MDKEEGGSGVEGGHVKSESGYCRLSPNQYMQHATPEMMQLLCPMISLHTSSSASPWNTYFISALWRISEHGPFSCQERVGEQSCPISNSKEM